MHGRGFAETAEAGAEAAEAQLEAPVEPLVAANSDEAPPAKKPRGRSRKPRAAEPVAEIAAAPQPEPEPQPEPVLATAATAEPEPAPTPAAPDPAEITAPPAAPRRGWWRRG